MIEIRNLEKRFDRFSGITYQNLRFETGKSYVLLGASGCGKSTLLNLIAGILSPGAGSIWIDGKEMSAQSQRERDNFRIHNIGYIFQDFKLIDEMSVRDNIDILRLEGVDTSGMDSLLDNLGILALKKKRVSLLSGGEKQRLAIARALIKKPSIILADEPTGNLNYAIGRKVVEALLDASRGKTLLCVTHDERLAELFDELIDMNEIAAPMEEEDHASLRA